ncbi:MAG TPA: hypothetical protein VLA62_10175 [Solirubrobacterales bacterium]|nr:hypothetical protein [Solirubrobacterales bacterium]
MLSSRAGGQPPLDFGRVLDTLLAFFDREAVPAAVIGAFGLHAYGLTRATQDLDLAVPAEAQSALVAFLESLGYETLHRSAGYSNHLHPAGELGRVDVVYLHGETSDRLFAACQTRPLGSRQVRVPRPEHLIAMKVQAMANDPTRTLRELADIQFLLSLDGVDQAEVRGYFARAGLLDRYDEIQRLR